MTSALPSPDLPPRHLAPPGFTWGKLTMPDGVALRWGHLPVPAARIDAVIVGGFCEFIEKYFELAADLADRGMAVWMLDWRGQGGSQRPAKRPLHPRGSELTNHADDLAAFVQSLGASPRPRVIFAHSMGAAIVLRALSDRPALFDAAVLSGPMIAITTAGLPRWLAVIAARAARLFGFGSRVVPGVGILDFERQITPDSSDTSHDPLRSLLTQSWYRARPDLRMAGATFGWIDRALAFTASFAARDFDKVRTPILIGLAGKDVYVDVAAARALAQRLPTATLVEFAQAKHELFHERDDIRAMWLAAIDDFLRKTLPAAA